MNVTVTSDIIPSVFVQSICGTHCQRELLLLDQLTVQKGVLIDGTTRFNQSTNLHASSLDRSEDDDGDHFSDDALRSHV